MKVNIYNTLKRFCFNCSEITAIAREVVASEGFQSDEMALHFVGRKRICRLHRDFFDDPSLTDCISFPIDGTEESSYHVLGELFICPEAALLYIKEHGGDFSDEITLYIIHGLLHLLGYDDIDPADKAIMRQRERFHQQNLLSKGLRLSSSSFH